MKKINPDSFPSEDLLNRKVFADEIAKGLKRSFTDDEDSFVFGLNGKWGSGKTVLMQYLKKSLKRELSGNEDYKIVDFNPWMFSGKEELLSIFLNQLAKDLAILNPRLKQKISSLANALNYLDGLKYISSTLSEYQKLAKDAASNLSKKPSIAELKRDVDEFIVKKGIRLFIFIDDLDRLTPDEVLQIFQIIKLNANFKNTIFVIAYDKEVVQRVLNENHGFDGSKYLEKIIQVDYRIPDLLPERIEEIFFLKLNELFRDLRLKHDETEFRVLWVVKRFRYYFVTLRDIYRYFNALKLRLPGIMKDVDLTQFCVIEAIRIFDYDAYEFIQRSYKRYIQFGPQAYPGRIMTEISNENTQILYDYLFEKTFNSGILNSVSDPQYFDRYFALSLNTKDVRQETVERFLHDRNARLDIMEKATENGSIKNLLVRLKAEKIELEAINRIIRWKAHTEMLFIECRDDLLTVLGHIIQGTGDFAQGMNYLVEVLPSDDGNFNPAIFYLIYYFNDLVYNDDQHIFLANIKAIENNRKTLNKIEVDTLKRYENDNLVFQRPYTRTDFFHKIFLGRYRKIFPDEYGQKLTEYLKKQENLFTFLGLFISPEAQTAYQINPSWLLQLVNESVMDMIEVEMGGIVVGGLPKLRKIVFDIWEREKSAMRSLILNQPT